MLAALATLRARVHKLTPPLTQTHVQAGHGFHFRIPGAGLAEYLDLLPRPPRVGAFDAAARRASVAGGSLGAAPVVAIQDLVPMKRTRRQSDYESISRLVRVRFRSITRPTAAVWRWALLSTFDAEDLADYVRSAPAAGWRGVRRPAARALRRDPTAVDAARLLLAEEMARLQSLDTAYWRRRRAALKRMRQRGELLPEGAAVASLLRR